MKDGVVASLVIIFSKIQEESPHNSGFNHPVELKSDQRGHAISFETAHFFMRRGTEDPG